MNKEQFIEHVRSLIYKQVKYKYEPPYSLEEGMDCFYWAEHIYNLYFNTFYAKNVTLLELRRKFIRVKQNPQFLDIPLFYTATLGRRHIGVMLNDHEMTQSSINTNGVAICDITKPPWKHTLKYFYRLKNEI